MSNENGLDYYKERGNSKELLAEPVNLMSNVAFFAATLVTLPFCKSWIDGILSTGITLVGIGSTLYHARPCKLTRLCDLGAIVTWTTLYVFIWSYYMMGLEFVPSIGLILSFFGMNYLFKKRYGDALNGSADFVPVIVLLLFCGSCVWYKLGHPHLVIAGILAAAALVFRVIDNDVRMPAGTHFLWHILNGFMLTMLTVFVTVYIA